MYKMAQAEEKLTDHVAEAIRVSLHDQALRWPEAQAAAAKAIEAHDRYPAEGWPFDVDLQAPPARLHKGTLEALDSIDATIFSGDATLDDEANLYISAMIQRWSKALRANRLNALEQSKDKDFVDCVEVLMKYDGPVYAHVYSGGRSYLAMLTERDRDTPSTYQAVQLFSRDLDDIKNCRTFLRDAMAGKAWIGLTCVHGHWERNGLEGRSIEEHLLPDADVYLWEPDEDNPSHSPL